MLLTLDEWRRCEARALADGVDQPVVGVDLGGARAWSSAVALWPSGRLEAFAVTAGIPDVEAQESRDLVPKGSYARLVREGSLLVDAERHIPRVSVVVDEVMRRWPGAAFATADRFRLPELLDAFGGRASVVPRVTRWSESSFDIRALRGLALDGALSVEPSARALMRLSLAAAQVENDSSGNSRLKKGSNNCERDDAAAALVLAAGALARIPVRVPFRLVCRASGRVGASRGLAAPSPIASALAKTPARRLRARSLPLCQVRARWAIRSSPRSKSLPWWP